ncbi:MAG: 2-C-methyl-D-erythritol 4-phosphate cytidylyltransferase [Gammaproteobacteria bacterium]
MMKPFTRSLNPEPHTIWAVIPAAGIGSRMQADVPKQYLTIRGRSILARSIDSLHAVSAITGVVLVGEPSQWPDDVSDALNGKPWMTTVGGVERCHSVLNGLRYLSEQLDDPAQLSVLVHDAARPCVRVDDILRLIDAVGDQADGGILGVPVSDTLKQSAQAGNDKKIIGKTIDRSVLWQAQTPQFFKLVLLADALEAALQQDKQVTDEASAMELAGYHPQLVEGHADNIKITRPEDLAMAEFFLQQQGRL